MSSVLLKLLLCISLVLGDVPIVRIPLGYLQGKIMQNRHGTTFYAFQSIPYAVPPIGNLRFKAPRKVDPWFTMLKATKESPQCVQTEMKPNSLVTGQEDCLYLNIYTRKIGKADELYPVFVYIHGGSFQSGSSRISELGPHYLLTEALVLVTINYRLGPFGNLNLGRHIFNPEIVANVGLRDQICALEWIRDYVEYFGGDPSRITVGGQSAGAMASHALMLSPITNGLFNQVICMSGNTLDPMVLSKSKTAQILAHQLGVKSRNVNEMIYKLKSANIKDIINATYALRWNEPSLKQPASFGIFRETPSVYSVFDDYPLKLLTQSKNLPLLIGSTNAEGIFFESNVESCPDLTNIRSFVPYFFTNQKQVVLKIKKFYNITDMDDTNVNNPYLWTDLLFGYNTYRTVRMQSQLSDVFYFQFSQHYDDLHYSSLLTNSSYSGAAHTDDLAYLFSSELVDYENLDHKEKEKIEEMVQLFTNFIRFGKPLLESKNWPSFNQTNQFLMNITNNGLTPVSVRDTDLFTFWDSIYCDYANRYF